jgi:predicted O-linked N-acetylglucosamine transferase (SPINDLY family)
MRPISKTRVAASLENTLERALEFHRQGRLAEAEQLYRLILRTQPHQFDALRLLGGIKLRQGAFPEAAHLLRAGLRINPHSAEAHANLGLALSRTGRGREALVSYDLALALDPASVETLNGRGVVLYGLHEFVEALASFDQALALDPGSADAWYNRGNALLARALLEPLQATMLLDEALAAYNRAVAIRPDYPEAWNNRGTMLRGQNRFEEALASFDKAIALAPAYAEAHNNRGYLLRDLKRFDEAVAAFDAALAIRPHYAETLFHRATTLRDALRFGEAIATLESLLRVRPDFPFAAGQLLFWRLSACDWSLVAAQWPSLLADVRADKPVSFPFTLLMSDSPDDQRRAAATYARDKCPASATPLWHGERHRHDRIRIAYLSADFREHPVCHLMAGLFEAHDHSQFETIAVSFGPDRASPMRARVMGAFDRFIDVRDRNDGDVAKLLYDLEVDIAVDLMGYTLDSRTGVLACRPAPVQVNYLGFAGTMAASYIDYIVADRVVIPETHRRNYSEQVVYLPDCFMATDDKRQIAEHTPSRSEVGLAENAFVFCSFNNSYKVTPQIFDIWMRLLRKVEGSVLWLSNAPDRAVSNLRREAQARGVGPERLVFAARTKHQQDHLARLRLADLFVDSLPYNAHTTASDALWAGLPLVTCLGSTFAGRVAGSLLMAIGLEELATQSLADYEAVALQLARDPGALAEVKARLVRNRTSHPLFDTKRFCRNLEAAYMGMWERHQRGEGPASFVVETQ